MKSEQEILDRIAANTEALNDLQEMKGTVGAVYSARHSGPLINEANSNIQFLLGEIDALNWILGNPTKGPR